MASARATATRWRMPPESSRGRLPAGRRKVHEGDELLGDARALLAQAGPCSRRPRRAPRSRRRSSRAAASTSGRRCPAPGPGSVTSAPSSVMLPAVGSEQPADQGDQRGLAGARVADHGHELALLERQIEPGAARAWCPRAVTNDFSSPRTSRYDIQVVLNRASTSPIRRSRTKPIAPIVMMHRMMWE